MNEYQEKLKERYADLFNADKNKPDWAVKKKAKEENIHPAIPFVGKSYEKTKLLIYASAENLNTDCGHLYDDKEALNRRENTYNRNKNKYFPDLHILPVTDGSLVIVSAYILKKTGKILQYTTPYEFIEHIAVDNFCKFSIENSGPNMDYAGIISKVRYSLKYVEADLKILEPDMIIMPEKIYNHHEVKQLITKFVPNCIVLPIYQINSRNINHPERIRKYVQKDASTIDDLFVEWQKNLKNGITGKTNKNFNSVYTYLDDIVKRFFVE